VSQNKTSHYNFQQGASKIVKNISTDGEVMAKIKVACFFLGHGV